MRIAAAVFIPCWIAAFAVAQSTPSEAQLKLTLKAEATPLAEVLQAVAERAGVDFPTVEGLDLDRAVDLDVRDAPLGAVFEALGLSAVSNDEYRCTKSKERLVIEDDWLLDVGPFHVAERREGVSSSHAPGLQLTTTVRPHADGLLIETWPCLFGTVARVEVAAVRIGGKKVGFETCERHSPSRVFVADPPAGVVVVQYTGMVFTRHVERVAFGEDGETRSRHDLGGGTKVSFKWPKLRINYRRPMPRPFLDEAFVMIHVTPEKGADPIVLTDVPSIEVPMPDFEVADRWCHCKVRKPLGKGPGSARSRTIDIAERAKLEKRPRDLCVVAAVTHYRGERFSVTSPPVAR